MLHIVNASAGEIIICLLLCGLVYATALILRRPPPYPDASKAVRIAKTVFWWTSVILWSLVLIAGLLSEVGQ